MWTEAEAKTKWCPEVRVSLNGLAVNVTAGDPQTAGRAPCVGSACMMWRWASKPNPDYRAGMNGLIPLPPPGSNPPYIEDRERGYCGKAGRP